MIRKITILTFLFCFFFSISAQIEEVSSHVINWKSVDTWNSQAASISVISFDGAQYPTESRLPYFNKRIVCDPKLSYQVEVVKPVFVQPTAEELILLNFNSLITNNLDVVTDVLNDRATSYLDISILPFINQQGKIMKLSTFDLVVKSTMGPQKIVGATRHTYASTSVLANDRFVKIKIQNTGIYKLTFEDLIDMGISPANVRIFGYGGNVLEQSFLLPKPDDLPEQAIWMEKGTDGVFNSGDYILFYGQGINKWTYNKSMAQFTHTINPYSKYGYYFVTSDAGIGKKIDSKTIELTANSSSIVVEEFVDFQVHEKDLVNIINSGKEFYGEEFKEKNSYSFPFTFPNIIQDNSTTVLLDVASTSTTACSFNLSLNGSQNTVLPVAAKGSDTYEVAKGAIGTFVFSPTKDDLTFNLLYTKNSNASAVGYLNSIEVNARRQLKMAGSAMTFQNVDYLGSLSVYNHFLVSDANPNVQIWDITDPTNIFSIKTSIVNAKLGFLSANNEVKRYLAIDPTASFAFGKPEIVGEVTKQNLHSMTGVDMVILSHPNFLQQAETLAKAHREKDNLVVEVITPEQVYNEFSSGTPDATAYRWVMKMLYDRASASNNTIEKPKYLLLFGKGTFDNRKILSNSGDNLILTYQAENSLIITSSYVTDDYFTLLDDNDGANVPANLMDIAVGRFPVTTAQQATDVVTKTINYMNNPNVGFWKNQLLFLGDDGDGSLHASQADVVAENLIRNAPSFQVNKIYLDAYQQELNASGESYPAAKIRFQNLLRNGLFMLNYTGHGGPSGWTNENILSINEVRTLSNKNLPLWVAPTCDFNLFDVKALSAGEEVVLNPLGGGIGILSAARPVYSSQNFALNKLFCDNLFKKTNGEFLPIGDAIVAAKNKVGTEINKLSYIYLGDPAVKLNFPTKYTVTTSKINQNSELGNDTLKALSVATIEGFIADENGARVTNFNGSLHAVIYDKVQQIKSLNNQGDGSFEFSDRQNTLFSGSVNVIDGNFSFTFMLPKDIKYNYGTGRINYYANDNVNNYEAQGYFENFIVGGTNLNSIEDVKGPEVQLFLNSTSFLSGDEVNEAPLFIANIMDENGINTTGSGIGHDLILTVEDIAKATKESFIINEYFQSKANSYTEGSVKYKLPEMADGAYKLTFRVFDLLNNSAVNTIDFKVVKGLTPEIFHVYNYPNPVKTQTSIVVTHDRPETILNTTVEVFDISGRKIWSKSQLTAENIIWNLTADNGSKVKTGIYFYRVNIKTVNSDIYSKSSKLIVVE